VNPYVLVWYGVNPYVLVWYGVNPYVLVWYGVNPYVCVWMCIQYYKSGHTIPRHSGSTDTGVRFVGLPCQKQKKLLIFIRELFKLISV
jgi:hypothetical protein